MRHLYKSLKASTIGFILLLPVTLFAGNEDRIAANGANQLLINPWAKSSALGHSNTASVTGIESVFGNVSGLAFTKKTEVSFTHTRWLSSSGVGINNVGLAQRIGENGVLGLTVKMFSFGEIDKTTTDQPDGEAGTYSLQYGTIGLSYAQAFSDRIYAGFTAKLVTEGVSDAKASGVAFDGGVRYVTGKKEHIKFGIALKNVGPKMKFSGDGLSVKESLDDKEFTLQLRSESFEMPSTLSIGFSYDFYLDERADSTGKEIESMHRLTGSGTFLSNSFGKDQVSAGAEYAFKEMFFLRAGLVYESGLWDEAENKNIITGPTFGGGVAVPISKNGGTIDVDYAYRTTSAMGGIHTVGLRVNL